MSSFFRPRSGPGSLVLLLALACAPLTAGTLPSGFIDEYLVLGPYTNTGGAGPTVADIALDYLCDGTTNEGNILPEEGLEIELPEAPGGCAKEDTSYAGLDPLVPTVKRVPVGGASPDVLDFDANLNPNENTMGYAWVYVNNLTNPPRPLNYVMGVASDDSIQVKINRIEVFNRSIPRGFDAEGVVQDRFPVTLLPGGNLVQIKVFEGGGGWGFRARFESTTDCRPVESGGGEIEITADRIPLTVPSSTAVRTIVTSGNTQADITLAVASAGNYTLKETFDAGWTVSNVTGGGVAAAGSVTWTNVSAPSLSYRLARATDFSSAQGVVSGQITGGGLTVGVGGDKQIDGGVTPFVAEVLLTPEFALNGVDGCGVTPALMEGGWIADGGGLTDSNIIPSEGFEFLPEFLGASQLAGLVDGILDTAQNLFWTAPGDVLGSSAKLGVVQSDAGGYINYNGIFGDQNNLMTVAYFYVENRTAQNPLFLYCGAGSDDAIHVKLNGRTVWSNQACRGNNFFGDKFGVALDPGKNLFAVYIFEAGGGFDMTFRFEDANGVPIGVKTTLDPAGYDPDPAKHPIHELPERPKEGIYTQLGFVTQFLVPAQVFEQPLTSNTKASAIPDDYITIDGNSPDVSNVAEGAPATPGTSGEITTEIRGGSTCGFTPLVLFDGVNGPTATVGDPGLFDGERFYGNPDNYSSTVFFFLDNKTGSPVSSYIGFASDDAASLFVNGERILEFLVGRGFGGANTIQTGPAEAVLNPGVNLVQLSYTEGGGGSGVRVGVWSDCKATQTFAPNVVQVYANPPGFGGNAVVSRSMTLANCAGEATVTLTVDTLDNGPAQVSVVETLPTGITGKNPSRGSFNAAGTVLSFSGELNDNDTITYQVNGATAGASYCLGTANLRPITGGRTFSTGTDWCGNIDDGIYINCGGQRWEDDQGRVWQEDRLTNPSPHLTSPNANTAQFGLFNNVDLEFDPFIAEREYPIRVFPTERWNNGPVEYTFTGLPNGNYEVVLLFMEGCCSDGCDNTLEDPVESAGSCRVFDATVNGVFPTNENSPAVAGEDGDQYSQYIAAGSANRVATHLSAVVPVTDGKIVVLIEDLGNTAPPENASIKAIAIEKQGGVVGKTFHRGDADNNGQLQLTDAVRILGFLFLGQAAPTCLDAADADDNGQVQLTDAVRVLGFLFLGQAPPAPPGPPSDPCGTDPTPEDGGTDLGCESYTSC